MKFVKQLDSIFMKNYDNIYKTCFNLLRDIWKKLKEKYGP